MSDNGRNLGKPRVLCLITAFFLAGFFAYLEFFIIIINWNYWQVYHRGTTPSTTIISLSNTRRSVDPYRSFSRNTYSINSWMKTVSILRVSVGVHFSLHCSCSHRAWFSLAWESLKALVATAHGAAKVWNYKIEWNCWNWQQKIPEGIGWSSSRKHNKWVKDPFRRFNNFF